MGEIVNLRRAKKAKARAAAEDEAASNRALHGTPKPFRDVTKARSKKSAHEFEAHRLDPGKPLKD
jgi:hypothetical protein